MQRPQVQQQPSTDLAAGDRDQLLQLSRRLDWRFLLPTPQLGKVAYLGPVAATLPGALYHFCDSLTLIAGTEKLSSEEAQESKAYFDQVVVCSQRLADAQMAASLLAEGGYLYWEIKRPALCTMLRTLVVDKKQPTPFTFGKHRRWDLASCRKYSAYLAQLGFTDIAAHWHRPDFENCLEFIPLDDPIALASAFARSAGSLLSMVQLAIGRKLIKTPLLAYTVPCFSIVACKGHANLELL